METRGTVGTRGTWVLEELWKLEELWELEELGQQNSSSTCSTPVTSVFAPDHAVLL